MFLTAVGSSNSYLEIFLKVSILLALPSLSFEESFFYSIKLVNAVVITAYSDFYVGV